MSLNPQREFVIQKTIPEITKAILEVQAAYSNEYRLERNDPILSQVRFLWGRNPFMLGYCIDFFIVKQTERDSKVTVKVGRAGAGSWRTDMVLATTILNTVTHRLSNSLQGKIQQMAEAEFQWEHKKNSSLQKVLLVLMVTIVIGFIIWVMRNRM